MYHKTFNSKTGCRNIINTDNTLTGHVDNKRNNHKN